MWLNAGAQLSSGCEWRHVFHVGDAALVSPDLRLTGSLVRGFPFPLCVGIPIVKILRYSLSIAIVSSLCPDTLLVVISAMFMHYTSTCAAFVNMESKFLLVLLSLFHIRPY